MTQPPADSPPAPEDPGGAAPEAPPPDASGPAPEGPAPEGPAPREAAGAMLVGAIFVAAASGLVYELLAGTLSSYLLGDSVTQFSIVIGLFLTSMGIGSYLSGQVEENLEAWFVGVELGAGLVGGLTGLVAFAAFATTEHYTPVLVLCVLAVGALVGFEVPLVVRILRKIESLRFALAHVLAADYLGALAASLAFPFFLLPKLGLVRAGLLMGLLNVGVGVFTYWVFRRHLGRARRPLLAAAALSSAVLLAALLVAPRAVTWLEARLYQDEVILAHTTPMQRVVLTRWRGDVRLFLNGHLQFSSVDEYRYHEALVHPAMSLAPTRARVLILGGGDGLAAREVLRFPGVERVDLVDIDPFVTELFARRDMLVELNGGSLKDPRVKVHNTDAMRFLETSEERWDVVLIDLPDPSTPSLAKLYSKPFYRLVARHMSADGVLCTQATSPFRSRQAFWCIFNTLEATDIPRAPGTTLKARAMHSTVPTFGIWGFVLAGARRPDPADIQLKLPTRYLTPELLPTLFEFPADMARLDTPVSHLDAPAIHQLYLDGYHKYLQ